MTVQRMPRKAAAPPHPITNSSGKPEDGRTANKSTAARKDVPATEERGFNASAIDAISPPDGDSARSRPSVDRSASCAKRAEAGTQAPPVDTIRSEKPEAIPQDVWDDALHFAGLIAFYATDPAKRDEAVTNFIAEALMDGRERCAKIAEGYFDNAGLTTVQRRTVQQGIAAAIRTPTQAHADAGGDTL